MSEPESLSIILDGTGALTELPQEKLAYPVSPARLLGLPGVMKPSGSPAVAIVVELPDGQTVVVKTSLALFLTAGDALKARYGDPRGQATRPGPQEVKKAVEKLRVNGGNPEVFVCSPLEAEDIQDQARALGLKVKHHPSLDSGTSILCAAAELQSLMERLT